MAKKLVKSVKVLVLAGKATPAPPLGPALGQAGINIGEFVNQFNARCQKELPNFIGQTVTAMISVYDDRTFSFRVKTPPASNLVKKAAGVESGSGKNLVTKAGSITKKQLKEIAEVKMKDLNANDVDAAMKIIEGTARSAGIEVKG